MAVGSRRKRSALTTKPLCHGDTISLFAFIDCVSFVLSSIQSEVGYGIGEMYYMHPSFLKQYNMPLFKLFVGVLPYPHNQKHVLIVFGNV